MVSYSVQGQNFLTRHYLHTLPGKEITDTSDTDAIKKAIKIIYKPKIYEDTTTIDRGRFKGKTKLDRLSMSTVSVIPLWRFNGNELAKFLRDSSKEENDRNARLSGTTEKDAAGTLFAELLNDFTGVWRITLASAVTASRAEDSTTMEESTTKDIQNFFAGGGNLIVKASLPLVMGFNTKYRHTRNFGIFFVPKASVSFPAFGTTATEPTWNIDAGLETEVYAGGIKEQIGFYGRLRVAGVWTTQDFTKQLLADERRLFGYGQANIGTLLQEKVYINVNFPVSVPIDLFGHDDPIDRIPVSVSAGILFH